MNPDPYVLPVIMISTSVFGDGRNYIHTCRSYVHTPRDFANGASLARRLALTSVSLGLQARLGFYLSNLGLLREQSSPKIEDSLPRTPMNHCAKFDAASFIFGGKIHNCTNTQKTNKQTVTKYIHTLSIGICG